MGAPTVGEVILVPFPFSDLSQSKVRPAVCLADGEDDLFAVARYIVANPVRAGLVERIGDYPFWDSAFL